MEIQGPAIEGREAAERFVDLLTRGDRRSLCWRLIPRKGFDGAIREPEIPLDRFYKDGFDKLQGDYNTYAVVNGGGRRDAHIDHVRAFFIDGDDVPLPKSWHVEPHFICVRDDRHFHAYWLAADGVTPEQFREGQKRLAKFYDTDSRPVTRRQNRAPD